MKAVVVKPTWGPIENLVLVANYPISDPEDEFVQVKIYAAAFNPVDYKIRQGIFPDILIWSLIFFIRTVWWRYTA
jgi:NADPH:quinone reductase-like Zn-dependent oxidoreductase